MEIKRHAMTKRAAVLFELPGSCDSWKDERLHEVVHDGTSHEFDGCRYGLKQRYAKKPLPIKKPWRVVSWNFELGCKFNPFGGFIYCCIFWAFLVLENIIKMTANTTVVNTNEFFCVPVGKSRQAAIFLGNLVKNAVEEGKRIPRRMEASSDLGTCIKWVEDIGVPVIYAYSAYYSAKCRGMMKGEGLEFLSKIFGLLSADECMLGESSAVRERR